MKLPNNETELQKMTNAQIIETALNATATEIASHGLAGAYNFLDDLREHDADDLSHAHFAGAPVTDEQLGLFRDTVESFTAYTKSTRTPAGRTFDAIIDALRDADTTLPNGLYFDAFDDVTTDDRGRVNAFLPFNDDDGVAFTIHPDGEYDLTLSSDDLDLTNLYNALQAGDAPAPYHTAVAITDAENLDRR